MAKANMETATYIVKVQRTEGRIETLEIYDQKNDRYIDFKTNKPALCSFLNEADMKESLNWCLNCYENKTRVVWNKNRTVGTIYMVD